MYCSNCEAYIPGGLTLAQCPSCEIDILNTAIPVERKREPLPPPAPVAPLEPLPVIREKFKPETDFNVFQALYYSFFSQPLYIDVARKWKGACFVYMTVLAAVAGIPMAASFVTQYGNFQSEHILPLVGRFPSIGIENQKLTVVEPSPYVLRDSKNLQNYLVFDTSGQTTSLNQIPTILLFTRDNVISRENSGQEKFEPYPAGWKLKLNNELLYFGAAQIERWMSFLVFPFMCAGVSFIFLFMGFFYSLACMTIAAVLKMTLDYGAAYRLSVVSMTPATFLSGLLTLLVQDLDERMMFFYLLPFGFLIYALLAIRRKNKKEELERLAKEEAEKKGKKRVIFI